MPSDLYEQAGLQVLFKLGPGLPDAPQYEFDGTPESWQMALKIRRRHYAQCQAADESFAAQHPGLDFPRLCDRPAVKQLLDDTPPDFGSLTSPA